jgi:imidazolonepropionase-like amidohydrolase
MINEKRIFLVPTVGVIDEAVEKKGAPTTPELHQRMDTLLRGIEQQVKEAMSLGVKMASGFDASEAGLHGKNAEELVGLVRRGLSPADAIRAATVNAAELLGWQDRVGAVEAGKFADLIAVNGDPLADITVLLQVKFVMKEGTVVKDALTR